MNHWPHLTNGPKAGKVEEDFSSISQCKKEAMGEKNSYCWLHILVHFPPSGPTALLSAHQRTACSSRSPLPFRCAPSPKTTISQK
jgi:hypothetical protein